MKFKDIFVPRWQNSNPNIRIKAIERMQDISLLRQIAEKDDHPMVRDMASDRLARLVATEKITE
jgi:hypothetical protein